MTMTRQRLRAVLFSSPVLLASTAALGQAPAAAAPAAAPPAAAPPAAAPPAAAPPAAAATTAAPAPVSTERPDAVADVRASMAVDTGPIDVGPKAEDKDDRDAALEAQNGLSGATGLLRTLSADSGGVGTFRASLIGSYFTGGGFLCNAKSDCETPNGVISTGEDDVTHVATRVGVSVTPASFLEAYGSLRYQSTENDQGDPPAIQLVGDTILGVKGFLPTDPERVFGFGGSLEGRLLSSPGGVGLDAGSLGLRALSTLDFERQADPAARFPLRVHLNLGYLLDGGGALADDVEKERKKVLGPNQRITRIERFAHDLNRVDSFQAALGVEAPLAYARPFLEWSAEIPVNRQDHKCGNSASRTAGDSCLLDEGFAAVPSRLSVGVRGYPWAADWLRGLQLLAAFDIGTGATSTFVEEVAPQLPWTFHLGAAWAADTGAKRETQVVEKIVDRAIPPPPERFVEGLVQGKGKSEPVAGAIVRYAGQSTTGMVADDLGRFRTGNLPPGEYRLAITADGYAAGECVVQVPETPPGLPAAAPSPGAPPPPAAPPADTSAPQITPVTCELEALPRTATITGSVRDADTTVPVENAAVTIMDPLGRSLTLRTDTQGNFRFANVVAGKSKLSVEADGFLRGSAEAQLEARKDLSTDVFLHARPKVANVVLTKTELKLKKEVHFLHGSAELLSDSQALLEEAADVLRSHPEIGRLEVQGHTDDSGSPELNQRLSTERASAVREALIANGVDASRLVARGYGQDKPLVPNTSAKNRAKNRRVQLVITP